LALARCEQWGELDGIYAELFGAHRPARVVMPVPQLHHGLKVELEATAYLGK
jgi:2-iminobutanoate/2-iminopropanoate deaminase